ncbi:MAG TPA: ABC transporter ATP-binding protein [Candidatus Bathyarchaeia archaeon]|nr:ABC transporter ATP-binding protein [Candidatus Bathyarchaeia archaeon]
MLQQSPILSIRNLKTYFYTYAGVVRALEGIDLDIYPGETVGLVGETGCGKSVTALSVMQLVPNPPGKIVDGEILFHGEDLLKKSEQDMREIRGKKITMVFQDPMTYMNPVMTVGDQIAEVIMLHQDLSSDGDGVGSDNGGRLGMSRRSVKKVAMERAIETLKRVRMPYPEKVSKQYPHELSGGMRQRAMIAMALSCGPDLLIADEPTTALDVTIQAQILTLLNELKKEIGTSVLLITHDLGIVAEVCDRVGVMYAGKIIELAQTRVLFRNPSHPYTQGLLRAIPKLYREMEQLDIIPGSVPNLINPPSGCRFHPRCQFAMKACSAESPQLIEIEGNHLVSCFLFSQAREREGE